MRCPLHVQCYQACCKEKAKEAASQPAKVAMLTTMRGLHGSLMVAVLVWKSGSLDHPGKNSQPSSACQQATGLRPGRTGTSGTSQIGRRCKGRRLCRFAIWIRIRLEGYMGYRAQQLTTSQRQTLDGLLKTESALEPLPFLFPKLGESHQS